MKVTLLALLTKSKKCDIPYLIPVNTLFDSVAQNKQLNFIVNVEKYITDLLHDLKNYEVISETINKILKQRGSRFGIPYGLCKIHKHLVDNLHFRPIMSAIKRPIYHIYIIVLFVGK